MDASLLTDAAAWAKHEFSDAQLNDKRRTDRLVKVAEALARKPEGALPGSFGTFKELKATYRLLESPEVTYEQIMAVHCERTQASTRQPGDYLLLEDTTSLDFTSHPSVKGLGRIGDDRGRGLLLHTTLALEITGWENDRPQVSLSGIWSQEWWARQDTTRCREETRRSRLQRPRESQRWAKAIECSDGPTAGVRWTHVADRESDIYEVFLRCRARGSDFIVRANQPRALAKDDHSILELVAQSPVLGHYTLHLRSRPGQAARTATLQVRAFTATLRGPWRPDAKLPDVKVNVVQAVETDPPSNVQPIRWVLFTSWQCDTLAQALQVIGAYAQRWLVEEYHKALKTGAKIEQSQLSTADRLTALLGVVSIVAVRLLSLKLLVKSCPEEPVESDETTQIIITILEKKTSRPQEGWNNRTVLIGIAKLGGFPGRRRDGLPGWITLWRGLRELMLLLEGFSIAREHRRCGE